MKPFLLFLFVFSTSILIAQNSNSIEIYASSNYANFTNKILINDEPTVSFNFGIGYNFISDRKWNFTTGLRFADFVTKYSNNDLRWGSQHNGQGGFDPNAPSGEPFGVEFKNHYYFLEIPIGIKYRILDKKIKLYFEPTINPAMFLTHRNHITKRYGDQPNQSELESNGPYHLRKFNFFGEMGVALLFPLSKKISLQVRPSARIQLLNAIESSINNPRLYGIGLKLGLCYFFADE